MGISPGILSFFCLDGYFSVGCVIGACLSTDQDHGFPRFYVGMLASVSSEREIRFAGSHILCLCRPWNHLTLCPQRACDAMSLGRRGMAGCLYAVICDCDRTILCLLYMLLQMDAMSVSSPDWQSLCCKANT